MINDSFGFDIYRGEVRVMDAAHRHQELELNLIFKGSMSYLLGGSTLKLVSGQLALFWATMPHRIIACERGTEIAWVTLPIASVLRYDLPEHLMAAVLQGKPIIESFNDLDAMIFNRWLTDIHNGISESTIIVELELEAWLRRLALSKTLKQKRQVKVDSKAAQIAQYISENYQEHLSMTIIATAVSLNPSYAATLFKHSFGMTINEYLSQYRIAHAQRLLVTTNMPILDVAFEAGFGSSSQFYAIFLKACGSTPRQYRQALSHRAYLQLQKSSTS